MTAETLTETGVNATLITDGTSAALFRDQEMDGHVVHEVGTLQLAGAAHEFGVPFHAPDPKASTAEEAPIEHRDGDEVLTTAGHRTARHRVRGHYPALAVTPTVRHDRGHRSRTVRLDPEALRTCPRRLRDRITACARRLGAATMPAVIDPRLDGSVVLVTGGAGGIGAAITRTFAAQSAKTAVHYLGAETDPPAGHRWEHVTPNEQAAGELVEELDTTAVAVAADLGDPAAITRLFDEVETALGPVDVLVNNAAHCENPDSVDTLTAGSLERHYRVNAIAPALLTAELARRRREPGACVVNISTDAARAFPGQTAYGTSKAALEALTRSTALDLAASGLRVNAVAPGPVQTGWLSGALLEHATEAVPMGRVGTPADVADAVVFLASHQARWITGQVVQVAGGHAL